ncbi:hypothetical protein FB45DRAFT_1033136, partial [Roridomyces roridus]
MSPFLRVDSSRLSPFSFSFPLLCLSSSRIRLAGSSGYSSSTRISTTPPLILDYVAVPPSPYRLMAPRPRPLDSASAKARFLSDPWKPIRDGGDRAFVFFTDRFDTTRPLEPVTLSVLVRETQHYFQFLKRYRDHAQGEVIPEIEAFFAQCFDVLARLNDVSGLGNKNLKGTAAYRPMIPSDDPSRVRLNTLRLLACFIDAFYSPSFLL